VLQSHLDQLDKLRTTLESHLNDLIPDWKVLVEYVPAAGPVVDSDAIAKAVQEDDMQGLLTLKKNLERDIAILKGKLRNEEETISEYTVRQILSRLIRRNMLHDGAMIIRPLFDVCWKSWLKRI
jgi:hypothetical protein